MKHASRWIACLLLMFALCVTANSATADDRPMKMSEVSRLIDQGQSPQDVLEEMAERGVSFRASSAMEKRLKKFGFTDEQIELVGRIASGEKIDLDAEAQAPEGGDADAENANDDALKVGFPHPEGWHTAEQRRVERAIQKSGLGYARIELTRVTLYCGAARAQTLAPLLKRLEAALIQRFPATISSASSPKSAHIVIVDGPSEWRSWVEACVDSYAQDGINFRFGNEADPKEHLAMGNGFIIPTLAATNASAKPNEQAVQRFATYALGHLMMERAGGDKQPKGLTTGFGDLAEEIAMGTPSVMIYSYEKRDLKQAAPWKQVVRDLFAQKKIDNPATPWGYETSTMQPQHYAECWSLVSTLSQAPDKFAQAVTAVRDEGKTMNVAVTDAYDLTDRKLLEAWFKHVNQ